MKEKPKSEQIEPSREQRLLRLMEQLRQQPQLLERLESIVGMTRADGERLATADEIEERLVEEVRRLGGEVMERWAISAEARAGEEFKQSQPQARVRKKKS